MVIFRDKTETPFFPSWATVYAIPTYITFSSRKKNFPKPKTVSSSSQQDLWGESTKNIVG
jgi:hypothetical protein